MGVLEDLARARQAFERREWVTAYDALSGAEDASVPAQDFARLATTAHLLGRRNDCIQALQRAYTAHAAAGETPAAVRCAVRLATVLLTSGEGAVAGGWVARAQRMLAGVDGDLVERGHVLVPVLLRHIVAREYEQAHRLALEITDYGRRFDDADLLATGLNAQGRLLLYSGHVPEGLALLDEAMIGISTGDVSPVVAGETYCSLVEACQEVSDFGRAAEWTAALTAWIEGQPGLVAFTGQCAVHRGQIMRLRGAFREAVEEFELAVERYERAGTPAPAGLAMAECGGVLCLLGDLTGAHDAYERAIGFGHEPQPGLALLWLARGRTADALAAIRRLLAEPRDPVHRSQLLPAAVEILVGTGLVEEADAVSEELASVAASFGCPGLSAMAHHARGSVLLAAEQPGTALAELREAEHAWHRLEAPYEIARCRLLIGGALRALGDEPSAHAELAAARRAFHELGTPAGEAEARRLLGPGAPRGLTDREVEVLRLVATGRTNPEIAAELFLSEKTVSRHLSNIFTKLDVPTRTAAAAFAYEHGLVRAASRGPVHRRGVPAERAEESGGPGASPSVPG
ncbi:LuxR C-terminal-related transcriptional regulator [Kocuria sp. CH-021]|uniref:LuxR C-terminal-related transcriptional regulator n=1 Tax=Kocuria sp. CH-021 TaxID=3406735 RepID=UPI003C75FA99